jgi:hypothetical protein
MGGQTKFEKITMADLVFFSLLHITSLSQYKGPLFLHCICALALTDFLAAMKSWQQFVFGWKYNYVAIYRGPSSMMLWQ